MNTNSSFQRSGPTRLTEGVTPPVALLLFITVLSTAPAVLAAGQFELVCEVPPVGGLSPGIIEAIQVLDEDPNQIVLAVRNQGANCGWGTPVSIWKAILDPATGECLIEHKQQLSAIQEVRQSVFESSGGILFTGGGWCGYKPPYYSTDYGESWQRADRGVHPPNSTFSYAELNGQVYAGTGYEPYHGEVYRWLGNGSWQRVLDLGRARNIVNTLLAHDGLLFVGSIVYGHSGGGCGGTVPIYVSSDGTTFDATSGIPSCFSISALVEVGDDVVSFAYNRANSADRRIYRWLSDTYQWQEIADINWYLDRATVVASGNSLYGLGRVPDSDPRSVFQSDDLGQTWQQVASFDGADGYTLTAHGNYIYVGTRHDAGTTYLHRMALNTPPVADAGSDQDVECIDHQETPVALDGSGSYDVDGDQLAYEWWVIDDLTPIEGCEATIPLPISEHQITLVVDDGRDTDDDEVIIRVEDTLAPILSGVAADITAECSSPDGTAVQVPVPEATDLCYGPVEVTTDAPPTFPLGETKVKFFALDPVDNEAIAGTEVKVIDSTPPEIVDCRAQPDMLWPAKHQMREIAVEVESFDVCDPDAACSITGVESNEPVMTSNEGDLAPDWLIVGGLSVELRVERYIKPGRIYTLTIACEDASGNSESTQVEVVVPYYHISK